ncbi:MAG: hypothetical protein C4538_11810 [Nitrospiraceae bacterium]|nr:MAG: hypothetical protein C4538_11810 [Nitrospiraceae bacterium]
MEKLIILGLTMTLFVSLQTLAAADVTEGFGQGIEQSPHNFFHHAWLPLTRICFVCHTIHDETLPSQRYSNGLLWQRNVSSVSYVLYHSYWGKTFFETRDKSPLTSLTGKRSNLPDGLSKLCLSCHDGLVAPDVFNLHHFVSAEYDITKTNLRNPDTTIMGNSGSITEVLDRGKVQCTSCHDVHGVESIPHTKLLREEKPKLCLTCHNIEIKE